MGNFAENLNLGNRFRPPLRSVFDMGPQRQLRALAHKGVSEGDVAPSEA